MEEAPVHLDASGVLREVDELHASFIAARQLGVLCSLAGRADAVEAHEKSFIETSAALHDQLTQMDRQIATLNKQHDAQINALQQQHNKKVSELSDELMRVREAESTLAAQLTHTKQQLNHTHAK
ncbi:unnamed protein product [Vitrella brassicaformis CCMP3155]|uniref:Uncharacterized protein n=1 Tax=Vitrella brassicaformis (strain CCMP3155) TaxID=1169540 RepID=A0A0G4EVH9_VITBC|nr:unnamed protein product [Vitrella brassicaformis CCMP3155]|eukprot:CEM02641.1 unnamed protein product [Vitrella brassicaformis CCMP3155]